MKHGQKKKSNADMVATHLKVKKLLKVQQMVRTT